MSTIEQEHALLLPYSSPFLHSILRGSLRIMQPWGVPPWRHSLPVPNLFLTSPTVVIKRAGRMGLLYQDSTIQWVTKSLHQSTCSQYIMTAGVERTKAPFLFPAALDSCLFCLLGGPPISAQDCHCPTELGV